jgi:hypothetical protein
MNTRLAASLLAALGGATALLMPATSQAGNVGYYGDNCYNTAATTPAIITAAGHTPVAVAALDAASLAGLQGLFINGCSFATNAAVDTAVNNGLVLIWHDPNWESQASKSLPGGQTVPYNFGGNGSQIDFPAGSPATSGPGGVIGNTSLDGGNASNHGYVAAASLPGGSQVLATQDLAANVTTFAYGTGTGRVVFSTIPLTCYFDGGPCASNEAAPGMQAYAKNIIAWAVTGGVSTTCASEGYTGTKLEWCKNICERGYTGSTLNMWIRRWIDRYRTLPYCAVN